MATTKKKTPSKSTAKKPAAKATAARKSPAKKVTPKVTAKKSAAKKQPAMQSFRITKDDKVFNDFRITRQTVYWIILVAFIIFAQLWILKLQIEVATLIDAQQTQLLEQ